MAFKEGDFIEFEYTAWRVADNSMVFTTDKKKAEENGIYHKDAKYGPQLLILGKGNAIKGLENAIKGMSINETKKIEISPQEAFGERNSDLVRIMPLSDFRNKDITPYPGLQLEIDEHIATVKSVNSGRVLVDLNHPLAGEKLLYEVKVDKLITGEKEKIDALTKSYDITPNKIEIADGMARITIGSNVKRDANYFINKELLVKDLLSNLNLQKIIIEEEYEKESSNAKESNTKEH
ncbi:MAG: FKBP-type peptidyl-prolyl cis-trans isomerase [Candidatus Micrarchaeia archaeon]